MTASVLFLGWGFGLAGRFDYAAQLLIVAAIRIVQLIVSPIGSTASGRASRVAVAHADVRTVQPMRQEAPTFAPLAS